MILAFVAGPADELSQQAVAFGRSLGLGDVRAVAIAGPFTPAAWAQTLVELAAGVDAVIAPGSDRGSEVLAHLAAKLELPMAANCVAVTPGAPTTVRRGADRRRGDGGGERERIRGRSRGHRL